MDYYSVCRYKLTSPLNCIDERKTLKEKQDEERLLQELLEVVSLRNNIVDSIEDDRLRFALFLA